MSATTVRFDLRALIHKVCAESAAADPATIAKEVGRLIDDSQLREAVDQALPQIVQNTIAGHRRSGLVPPDEVPLPRTPDQATAPAKGASWKRNGIRRINDRLRTERYSFGFHAEDWKFLGDFNRADCQAAAVMRRKFAAGNIREAEKFEKIDALLVAHAVDTVSELPEAVKDEVRAMMFGRSR